MDISIFMILRKFIALIAFLISISCVNVTAQYDFEKDKQYHAIAGATISQGTSMLINNYTHDEKLAFRASFMLVTAAAYGKEFSDSMNGRDFDWQDFGYTFVSGVLSAYINKLIYKRINKKYRKKNNIEYLIY